MSELNNTPYLEFSRSEWSALRAATPMTLTATDVERIRGINVELSVPEVEMIYLPLSRLLNLYVQASQNLFSVTDTFLGKPSQPVPYVIGVAGSVAVGKSTISRVLVELLSNWPDHPQVDLVSTDGFLYPNRVLEERGLMNRKGFPESFQRRELLQFISALKSGQAEVDAPVYSHQSYDVLPDQKRTIRRPDILILEGLNVLHGGGSGTYVSDFFDFSIYVDADPDHIEAWYVRRFLTLKDTAFQQPDSYFHRYAQLDQDQAVAQARSIWSEINLVNLKENIIDTRERATLILEKQLDHSVRRVRLRRR